MRALGGSMLFSSADASEFLFRVQEIDVAVSQGAGEDYLAVLTKMHKIDSEQEAFARLRPVRLALARYMARCGIIGVGGRDPMGPGGRANLVY
jgi:nuclear pore complex protein Nup85